ncbi:MAG: hypothetical protein O9284_05845 [Steroidobacteraceae bacterium]|jgi:hypothetical protein|nr:hypothetical protein [Steroidobacteraceae bacterium]
MDLHEFWGWVHVLLFAFWLGTDVGVFVCGAWLRDTALSVEQRVVLLKAASVIDLLPRASAALMLPVGVMLARPWGGFDVVLWTTVAWVAAIAWLALTATGMRLFGTPAGRRVQLATWAFLVGLALASFAAGAWWWSEYAGQPNAWVGTKLVLYGFVCLLAIGIEVGFGPVLAGFARLSAEASAADANRLIVTGMNRTLLVVAALYVVLLAASWVGVAKPA